MIEYLLDTNTVIALTGRKSAAILRHFEDIHPGAVGVCTIVAHELYYGAYKSQRVEHNLETLRLLFADLAMLAFDQDDARVVGEIRAQLARTGNLIGPLDVLIAGQAKRRGLIMVTNNLGEFRRVVGLRCEDWTQTPSV